MSKTISKQAIVANDTNDLDRQLASAVQRKSTTRWEEEQARLTEKMGEVAFHSMDAAYLKWVEETKTPGKESGYTVIGNDRRAHSRESWEVDYPNVSAKKHEMFVKQYLAEHNMEDMLGGADSKDVDLDSEVGRQS